MSSDADLTMREKMALRILAVMYRIIGPRKHSFQANEDMKFILTGEDE